MQKSLELLYLVFKKICIGCVNLVILDGVMVSYYGVDILLKQVVSVNIEDNCIFMVILWEKNLVLIIEKVIMMFDLGLNLFISGDVICVLMFMLIEEIWKEMVKQVKVDVENGCVVICNVCCDVNSMIKDLLKEKEIIEDDECKGEDQIQKLIDCYIVEVEKVLKVKEEDLMVV